MLKRLVVTSAFWAGLGRCANCMKKAFGAVILCAIVAAASNLYGDKTLTAFFAAIAVAATGLWLLHIIAYTTKVAGGLVPSDGHQASRRKTFGLMARVAGGALTASMFPRYAFACGTENAECKESNPSCCAGFACLLGTADGWRCR